MVLLILVKPWGGGFYAQFTEEKTEVTGGCQWKAHSEPLPGLEFTPGYRLHALSKIKRGNTR